jgi:hypothetical protein
VSQRDKTRRTPKVVAAELSLDDMDSPLANHKSTTPHENRHSQTTHSSGAISAIVAAPKDGMHSNHCSGRSIVCRRPTKKDKKGAVPVPQHEDVQESSITLRVHQNAGDPTRPKHVASSQAVEDTPVEQMTEIGSRREISVSIK